MKFGYTLIELLVVMMVMAGIGVMAFYALGSGNSSQAVTNAQLEFVTNVRAAANQTVNGADGVTVKAVYITNNSTSYMLATDKGGSATVALPSGVQIQTPDGDNYYLCLANPNLTAYTGETGVLSVTSCQCGAGSYFACAVNGATYTPVTSGSVVITFANAAGTFTKIVTVEGNGMSLARVTPQ